VIHLLNLNGRFVPLSFVLFNIYEQLIGMTNLNIRSAALDGFATVTITPAKPNIEPFLT